MGGSKSSYRVCYLIHSLSPAGAERIILKLVANLPNKFDPAVCYLGGDDTLRTEFEKLQCPVVSLGERFPYDPRMIYAGVREFRKKDFDIVHSHLPKAHTFGRIFSTLSQTEVIISTHHSVRENYGAVSCTLERITRPIDTATTAVSDGVRRSFGKKHVANWHTIHNGIDVEEFANNVNDSNRNSLKEEFGIGTGPVFLTVGRYTPEKAQEDVIRTFKLLIEDYPNSSLFIVGWGDRETFLRQLSEDLNIADNVYITGYRSDIHRFYSCADVFLLSSIREAFGLVLVEAMSAGLPIVASNIAGVDEVIGNNNNIGVLVPPRSPRLMAKETKNVIENSQYGGKESYRYARDNFGINKMVNEYVDLYEDNL